jgi:hypothetical protein
VLRTIQFSRIERRVRYRFAAPVVSVSGSETLEPHFFFVNSFFQLRSRPVAGESRDPSDASRLSARDPRSRQVGVAAVSRLERSVVLTNARGSVQVSFAILFRCSSLNLRKGTRTPAPFVSPQPRRPKGGGTYGSRIEGPELSSTLGRHWGREASFPRSREECSGQRARSRSPSAYQRPPSSRIKVTSSPPPSSRTR